MLNTIKATLAALAAVAVLGGAAQAADDEKAPMQIDGATTVDADKVIQLYKNKDKLKIIDSRKPGDYKAGHIETATNLPNTETNAETLSEHLASKSTPVLFYCNGVKCGRAADAVKTAVNAGYENVYYYALGMAEWKKKGLPLVQE
ncbi:Rhodanese-related sulfurtransferase [Limimonas halophila]|uniref:Rhodanese-related sulfurtransferase n=1 Tax=Limimonas halophila TaxID=1082479 RepID=A0A1G7KVZ7_9PROT|nr:rhodanese-like domain-containing protein [Limimonas halophila]SDF41090.1 Rhodanese-related sulfurtransferase [Limimonas halophila]